MSDDKLGQIRARYCHGAIDKSAFFVELYATPSAGFDVEQPREP